MNIKKQIKKWAEKGFKFSGIDRPGVRDKTGPYNPDATKKEKEDAKKNPKCPAGGGKLRRLKKKECPIILMIKRCQNNFQIFQKV